MPVNGSQDGDNADPLEGLRAEDPLEDEGTVTPPPPPMAAQLSENRPNAGMRPTLRPSLTKDLIAQEASENAEANYVELTLRWCVLQPTEPTGSGPGTLRFDYYDTDFLDYVNRGIDIRSVRVVDAPSWAVDPACDANAASNLVKMCPPLPERDDDFEAFSEAIAEHYGPSSPFSINRFTLWNEPNTAKNWGLNPDGPEGPISIQNRARAYSDRLVPFHDGIIAGDDDAAVDAGEIASGGTDSERIRDWTRYFLNWNHSQGRDGKFDALTLHAYSKFAYQIPQKVKAHRVEFADKGVTDVGVTEVAWGVSGASNYKCVSDEQMQADRLTSLMMEVRRSPTPIQRVTWFSIIDNFKDGGADAKCPDNTGYYDNDMNPNNDNLLRKKVNTYGLFKRQTDGTLDDFSDAVARPLRNRFKAESQ